LTVSANWPLNPEAERAFLCKRLGQAAIFRWNRFQWRSLSFGWVHDGAAETTATCSPIHTVIPVAASACFLECLITMDRN